jgi:glycosyltransferase involved in cell wall biosynthesis
MVNGEEYEVIQEYGIGISVLMPIYHKEKAENLNECLESLNEQTFPPNEIVIVKDGILTNELEKVLSFWSNKLPLKIVGYEKNRGVAYALNYGIEYCLYNYIARMDSDDICMPERFKKQVDIIQKYNNNVIVGTNILEFYQEDNSIKYIRERKYPEFTNSMSKTLYKGTPIAHPTVMISTKLLKEYKYDVTISSNEDIDLWFRMLVAGNEVLNVNESLLKYRITKNTFDRRNYKKSITELKIYCKYLVRMHGFSLMLIYPVARFFLRLLPASIIKRFYFSKTREKIFE